MCHYAIANQVNMLEQKLIKILLIEQYCSEPGNGETREVYLELYKEKL